MTNIEILKGSTFKREILVKDGSNVAINLTGYTARSQLRKNVSDASPFYPFTVTVADAVLGKLLWTMSASDTALIPSDTGQGFNATKYWYDLEIESAGGEVTRLLQGQANVVPEVTR